MIHFNISEYCIVNDPVPIHIADKILRHHIIPMSEIREELGFPVLVSQKAGYRPTWYEKKRGRSGLSQHTFSFDSKGAADYTAGSKEEIEKLLEKIKEKRIYTRVAYYPNNGFIHCDYKVQGQYQYFECESTTSKWKYKGSF